MVSKPCKDCTAQGVTTKRVAKYPGPRCTTHHREFKKASSARSHGAHIEKTYGINSEQYTKLYVYQGERCAICGVATGKARRLAVDHNHSTGEVRGLLCSEDNKMLGRFRDNPEILRRAAAYLEDPPARRVLP